MMSFPDHPFSAETAQSLEVEVRNQLVFSHALPISEGEEQFIGIGQRRGEASFSNGETAAYSNVFTFTGARGGGVKSQGYTKFAFADDSFFLVSWTSETLTDQDDLPVSKGEGSILKGAGRFQGIEGVTVFSGKQLRPASQDERRTALMKATVTFTLPGKRHA